MKHGTDWYHRYPQAYLGGVQGLTSRQHAVYAVALDLIYVHGGSVNNDPGWIGGWIKDMGPASVRRTIEELVQLGKLDIDGDQLTQKRARNEAKTKEKLAEDRAKAGKKGGEKSAEIRAATKHNSDLDQASAGSKTQPEKRRGDKSREESPLTPQGGQPALDLGGDKPKRPKRTARSMFPEDWRPDPELLCWAEEQGFPEAQALALAQRCVDHHRAKGSTFADHRAAYRTWLNNEKRFATSRPTSAGFGQRSTGMCVDTFLRSSELRDQRAAEQRKIFLREQEEERDRIARVQAKLKREREEREAQAAADLEEARRAG